MRLPKQVHPPCDLRSRESILSFLDAAAYQRGGRDYDGHWQFCFNVKAYGVDLTFENLIKRVKGMGYGDMVHEDDPYWLEGARAEYDDHKEHLFDWGIEDARRPFRSDQKDADAAPEDDAFNTLYDGTHVDVRMAFYGRSGGWLVLLRFEHTEMSSDRFDDEVRQWPLPKLRQLAEYIQWLKKATANPCQSIEEAAAFTFFANICNDVPTSNDRRQEWAADQSGEHEFATT